MSVDAVKAVAKKVKPDLGPVVVGAAYALPLFMRLTGLNKAAMRSARRAGLVMKVVGRQKFVTGQAWLDFLEKCES